MKKNGLSIMIIISGVSLLMMLNSCSIIGLSIGASTDKKRPEYKQVNESEVDQIKPGKQVEICLYNGETYTGIFMDIGKIDNETYLLEYDSARHELKSETYLPALGDTLIMNAVFYNPEKNLTTIEDISGIFEGFDFGYLLLIRNNNDKPVLIDVNKANFNADIKNNKYDKKAIQALLNAGKIPYRSTFEMKVGTKIEIIQLENIAMVSTKNKFKGYGKLVGFSVGIVLDAAALLAMSLAAAASWSSINLGPP